MSNLKNILITGANGQLGSEIRRNSKKYSFNFIFTDVDLLDITNEDAVEKFVKDNNINYIINCAAYTAVDKAEDDIELCYLINKNAPEILGKIAQRNEVKVVHVSTDYVFDGTGTIPYSEDMPTSPKSVYGKSKREGEEALLAACPNSIIIRTAWLYSIYGNNFVKTMIRLGQERDTLNVVADQTGTPTNAKDLAIAILDIVEHSENNRFKAGIYHFTDEGVTTWFDFTVAIHKLAGIECQINPITTDQYPTKALRPKYSVLDKSKIKESFDISIPQWEDSLKICIEELKEIQQ